MCVCVCVCVCACVRVCMHVCVCVCVCPLFTMAMSLCLVFTGIHCHSVMLPCNVVFIVIVVITVLMIIIVTFRPDRTSTWLTRRQNIYLLFFLSFFCFPSLRPPLLSVSPSSIAFIVLDAQMSRIRPLSVCQCNRHKCVYVHAPELITRITVTVSLAVQIKPR